MPTLVVRRIASWVGTRSKLEWSSLPKSTPCSLKASKSPSACKSVRLGATDHASNLSRDWYPRACVRLTSTVWTYNNGHDIAFRASYKQLMLVAVYYAQSKTIGARGSVFSALITHLHMARVGSQVRLAGCGGWQLSRCSWSALWRPRFVLGPRGIRQVAQKSYAVSRAVAPGDHRHDG